MTKIVSETDIGSANPIAKFFRGLGDSIKGILTGLLFIVISFVLVWHMVNQKKHSETIADLPLQTPQEVEGQSGMVMIQGMPTYDLIINEARSGEDVLFYDYSKEEYAIREVRSSRVVEQDGREVRQEIVEYEGQWRTVADASENEWSEFSLGNIKIDPDNAKHEFNTETLYTNEEAVDYNTFLSDEDLVDVPQKFREKVTGVKKDTELVVIGQVSSDRIASGADGTFFVSNKTPAELLEDQVQSEKTMFWLMAAIAWFLMAQGFTMLLGPITHVMNIIPGLGELTKGLLFFIFAVISAVIIFIAYIGMKFWWVILLAIIAFFAFVIFNKAKKGEVKNMPKKAKKSDEKK